MTATASCPNCGAEAAPGHGSCPRCGFAIVEESARRLARPPRAALLGTALAVGTALVLIVGLAALLPDDDAPDGPDSVPARAAEWQLERSLFDFRDDDSAAIACPRAIELLHPDALPRPLPERQRSRDLRAGVPGRHARDPHALAVPASASRCQSHGDWRAASSVTPTS